MGIEWEKIYNICGKNNQLSGMKFEEIVLEYLQKYYPKYQWENTQPSWDNNRDFISLILDNIWAEAKYKKDCSALEKRDIDLTMMSGLLNGNVEVIIFITNGYFPQTIMERIKQANNMHFFNIICITRKQLEYWLMLYPDRYTHYFGGNFNCEVALPSIAIITSVDIVDYSNLNSNILSITDELVEKHFYTMNMTFEANELSKVSLVIDNSPFSFVNAPGYAVSTNIKINPGIQQIQLLIYTDKCTEKIIELKYSINDLGSFVFPINIRIYPNQEPILSYSQQLEYKEQIIRLLRENSANGQIRILGGERGSGKTYLLQDILYHFRQTRQTAYFQFYSKSDYRNKMMICRLIIFINFGEIIEIFNKEISDASVNFYKTLLENKFDPVGGNTNLILDILSGCYDEASAAKIYNDILYSDNIMTKIIIPKKTPVSHLAIIDQTQNLNDNEFKIIYDIINQSIKYNNTSFLLVDSRGEKPIDYPLFGLSLQDIKYSLKNAFENWSDSFIEVIAKEFSTNPETFSESVKYLKVFLNESTDVNLMSNYLLVSDAAKEQKFIKLDRALPTKYFPIVGFVYIFEEGISKNILYNLGIDSGIIEYLIKKKYFKIKYNKVTALNNMYRTLFLKRFETKNLDSILSFLKKILVFPEKYEDDIFLPDVHALYCKYSKVAPLNLLTEMLTRLRGFAYNCDYKNLHAYGNIAYYFIMRKPQSAWEENDYMAMFYYGISLLHIDRKRGAIEIFRIIKNNAPTDSNVYFMASCELYNNLYNRFQIKDLDAEILITKMDLEIKIKKISNEAETLQSSLDLRIAYSTCLNRYMMILFMQDKPKKAEDIFNDFCEYSEKIPESPYTNKYNSMLGEWYLDYARGLLYFNPDKAKLFLEKSIKMIMRDVNEKRVILAESDLAFLNCSYYGEYKSEIDEMSTNVTLLQEKGFYNEYIRAIIRNNFCKLIHYCQNTEIVNSKGFFKIINHMKEEALKAELDTMVYISGRLGYQVRQYFAALEILLGNYSTASDYLNQNLKVAKEAGESYKKIIIHNIQHMEQITSITWGYDSCKATSNVYLADPRIW